MTHVSPAPRLMLICMSAFLAACSASGGAQSAPPMQGGNVLQGTPPRGAMGPSATASPLARAASSRIRVFFADAQSGKLVEGAVQDPNVRPLSDQASMPLANGAPVAVEVRTPPDATVVMIDTKSSITDLQSSGPGIWRGTLRYYNVENTGDPHSQLLLRIATRRSSIEKEVPVITLHDS